VTREPPVVDVDRALRNHAPAGFELGDLVHEQEGVTMGQDRFDLVLPEGDGWLHGASLLAESGC
jgi:hypothetical protein